MDDLQTEDIPFATNEDLDFIVQILDKATSQPLSGGISGWSGYFTAYASWDAKLAGEDPVFQLGPGEGVSIADAALCLFRLRVAQADVAAAIDPLIVEAPHLGHFAPYKACPYDFVVHDTGGTPIRELAGNIVFSRGLT